MIAFAKFLLFIILILFFVTVLVEAVYCCIELVKLLKGLHKEDMKRRRILLKRKNDFFEAMTNHAIEKQRKLNETTRI